jgi:hypothetical protein
MIKNPDGLDQWGDVFDRRSIGRTKISKDALLFFSEKTGVHSCTVHDVTNLGARSTSHCPLTISGQFTCVF